MKKKILFIIVLIFFSTIAQAQLEIVDDFEILPDDSLYWQFVGTKNADSLLSYVNVYYDSINCYENGKSLNLNWSVHNCESWGGFSRIEHWLPGDSIYDFSLYDTLCLKYNILQAANPPEKVHLEFMLYDVSNSIQGEATNIDSLCEVYYSFHYILDQDTGWNELKIPFKPTVIGNGDGFVLTRWFGISGNEQLDLDYIKGFAFNFAVTQDMEVQQVIGNILIDNLSVYTMRERWDFIYNGVGFASNVNLSFQGMPEQAIITSEVSYSNGHSVQWTSSATELNSGLVFTFDSPLNYNLHWSRSPLSFKIKTPMDMGKLKLVISDDDYDGNGPDSVFNSVYILDNLPILPIDPIDLQNSGNWKNIEIPLTCFDRYAGYDIEDSVEYGEMDSSRIWQIKFLIADSNGLGKNIYLDDILLGVIPNQEPPVPIFDVIADTLAYHNTIYWLENHNGINETYNIYFSEFPINSNNIESDSVQLLVENLNEEVSYYQHDLKAPIHDQPVDYYYVISCKNPLGQETISNVNEFVTNKARGIAVINYLSPFNFSADGLLDEWQSFQAFRIFPSEWSGTVAEGTSIDNDQDLSVEAWLACDDNNIYIAFNVTDDSVRIDIPHSPWNNDSPELFIGLYNWINAQHNLPQNGMEPDYHLNFGSQGITLYPNNGFGDTLFHDSQSEDFIFHLKENRGYIIETKISFDYLASLRGDSIYYPQIDDRIALDFSINDVDSDALREGILTYSPDNQNLSWMDVSRWDYTWIKANTTTSSYPEVKKISAFKLFQNYPNPFNPETTISYTLPKTTEVNLSIYDIRGNIVENLVNCTQIAGHYSVTFQGDNLPSGIYLYRINAGNYTDVNRMLLIK